MKSLILLGAIWIFYGTQSSLAAPATKAAGDIEFLILHNNDMHARFEQTSIDSGKCLPTDANTKKCYGGFARTAHVIRQYREEAKKNGTQVVYLNAGDTYTGTAWFSIFKDNITAAFLNKLLPDVISLGNHEFDEGVEGLVPFLNEVDFPVVAANLDLRNTPEMRNTKSLKNSTVLSVAGVKIGIIGYLTPDTKNLVSQNSVNFYPEVDVINSEAAKLKAEGVNIIIALGHSGYKKDQEIARNCPEVDIVIGGHSHSFLYEGKPPTGQPETVEGPYPTVVKQASGKNVPVVQAYAYSKYLGKLHVRFDKNGNLKEFDGTPILLNFEVPQDSDLLQLLEVYRPNVTELENRIVGYSKVLLEGSDNVCRRVECNLGNLVTDAYVHARVQSLNGSQYWTDAAIALLQGGGIRSSINKRSDGGITADDILTVLPFKNKIIVTSVHGKTIRSALERSAEVYETDSNGGFFQVSGIHVTYNMSEKIGSRVLHVEVLCAECDVPSYSDLKDNQKYNIIISDYLLEGGDGHKFMETPDQASVQLGLDSKVAGDFISQRGVVYPGVEERITILGSIGAGTGGGANIVASLLMTLIAYSISRLI